MDRGGRGIDEGIGDGSGRPEEEYLLLSGASGRDEDSGGFRLGRGRSCFGGDCGLLMEFGVDKARCGAHGLRPGLGEV